MGERHIHFINPHNQPRGHLTLRTVDVIAESVDSKNQVSGLMKLKMLALVLPR